MAALFYVTLAVATWTTWNGISLFRNYRKARAFGLPIIVLPVGDLNPLWVAIYNIFPTPASWIERLPFNLGGWVKYAQLGWQYQDAGATHRELGPGFVLCMPAYNEIIIADPKAALAIMTRRKEYEKPMMMYDTLNMFGPNVDSLEGEAWQRHRRLTAPSLNERVNPLVWKESSQQCHEMLKEWVDKGHHGNTVLREDISALTLHVIMWVGFGISSPYREDESAVQPPHKISYKEALFGIMTQFIMLVIFSERLLKMPFMPANLQRLGQHCEEFKLYMREMVQSEKEAIAKVESSKTNLLSTMVRASEEEWGTRTSGIGLKDDEIFGNLFIYSFAGFETTANALATAICYLAAFPEWQDWLVEEIESVIGVKEVTDVPFDEAFERMNRCRAIIYETQRLNGSVVFLFRESSSYPQSLPFGDTSLVIPPHTYLNLNLHGLHCDQRTWGPDWDQWRPSRWIAKTSNGTEEIIEPLPGSFAPWSAGPHVCPGRKFAQVEFVSVMTTLFKRHMVTPLVKAGQNAEEAHAEAVEMIKDCTLQGTTIRMRDTSRVPLVWQERKSATVE